jgi:hypothetical protein
VDAVELLLGLQLLHPLRTWILFQAEKVPIDVLSDMRIQVAKVPLGGRSDFNAVGQDSVSQFPHEVTERSGALLFRFLQGRAGVF